MNKHVSILVMALASAVTFNVHAYDAEMAAKIEPLAAKLDHAGLLKGGCKVAPEDVLKTLAADKERVTLLDVRTPAEAKVVALSHPSALHIPLDKLFKPENLARLPKDGRIFVVCHSGNRAAAATALLSAVGFGNVSYVNGGLIALVTNLTPKAVPVE